MRSGQEESKSRHAQASERLKQRQNKNKAKLRPKEISLVNEKKGLRLGWQVHGKLWRSLHVNKERQYIILAES